MRYLEIMIEDATTNVGLQRVVAKIPKMILPIRQTLFHGTDTIAQFAIPHGPAFFTGNEDLATHWTGWAEERDGHAANTARVLKFQLIQKLELIDLTFKGRENFERMCRAAFGGQSYQPVDLAAALDGIAAGWFMSDKEIMLVHPDRCLRPVAPAT